MSILQNSSSSAKQVRGDFLNFPVETKRERPYNLSYSAIGNNAVYASCATAGYNHKINDKFSVGASVNRSYVNVSGYGSQSTTGANIGLTWNIFGGK